LGEFLSIDAGSVGDEMLYQLYLFIRKLAATISHTA